MPTPCSRALLAQLAALALAVPAATTLSAPALGQDDGSGTKRRSLEDLLREAETERARESATITPAIERIVRDIESLRAKVRGPVTRAKQRDLEKLGPGALPLLVPYLEPGESNERAQIFRARIVADHLRETPSRTVTDALLDLARSGTFEGRLNALDALTTTPEPARVAPKVIAIASSGPIEGLSVMQTETVRARAYNTIASLKSPAARTFLQEALSSGDVDRASAALGALQNASKETSAPQVLALLATESAPKLAESIVSYYRAHEELLEEDEDHADAVGQVAVHADTSSAQRATLFHMLRLSRAELDLKTKRGVEPFAEDSRKDVRESARLLLASLGDRRSRKELLDPHDDAVRIGRNLSSALQNRARVHHDIGDWNDAARDWKAAMKEMAKERLQSRRKEPYVGLARALARMGKFREAAGHLEKAPLSRDELRDLGHERDFKKMTESKYRDVFHLDT